MASVLLRGSCAKFNNATQRLFGGNITPIVYVWETNDPANQCCAEARLLTDGLKTVVMKFPQSSARTKEWAKELAANTAYQWLCVRYPAVDLANV